MRSLQAVPEGGVLGLDELVGSICLQCRKFPYQRREIAGRVPDYVLRVLRTPLRQPNHLPEIRRVDLCHTLGQPWFVLHPCGRLEPFTTEKLYFYVYVRYESRLTSVRILLSLFPPITPIRALALATQTVLL